MSIFLIGDFISNTGPAVANRNLKKSLECVDKVYYSRYQTKFLRIIELFCKIMINDKIIICSFSKINLIAFKIANITGKSLYYYMHGCHKIEDKINNSIAYEDNVSLEKKTFDSVKKIICVSNMQKEQVSKVYPEYCNKFVVHYNCMDLSNFKFIRRKKKDNEFLIMSIGGDMPRKANLNICKAIDKLIKEKKINITYILLGKYSIYQEQFDKYQFIKHYDTLPYDKVLEIMSNIDLYIQNSKFETFGLAVIESLLQGSSLLLSKNIGALEVFKEMNDDYIINDNDNIKEIKNKIWICLKEQNASYFYRNLKFYEIDTSKTGKTLLKKLKEDKCGK